MIIIDDTCRIKQEYMSSIDMIDRSSIDKQLNKYTNWRSEKSLFSSRMSINKYGNNNKVTNYQWM